MATSGTIFESGGIFGPSAAIAATFQKWFVAEKPFDCNGKAVEVGK